MGAGDEGNAICSLAHCVHMEAWESIPMPAMSIALASLRRRLAPSLGGVYT
jgi:hypothetical protein